MSKKSGTLKDAKRPRLMVNGSSGGSVEDIADSKPVKSPATSTKKRTSLLDKVLVRFDQIDSALSEINKILSDQKHKIMHHKDQLTEHNRLLALFGEQVSYLFNLQKHITDDNRSLRERYGKDAFAYLDVIRLLAANKMEVYQTGNHKDLFVKSLFGQVYDSLARQVLAQEAADCHALDKESTEVVRTALETNNRNFADFNSDHGFDDNLIRLPKTTLYRIRNSKEALDVLDEEGVENVNHSGSREEIEDPDDNNNPNDDSNNQHFESCASHADSSQEDRTIVATNGKTSPRRSLKTPLPSSPKTTTHSTSQSNIDDDDNSLLDISSAASSTMNNKSTRRAWKIPNPIELTSMTFNVPNTSRAQSIASGFTGPFFSTPHPDRVTRGDELVNQIMTQRKAESENRKSSRHSIQLTSPVRAGGSQSEHRLGAIPFNLNGLNGHDQSSSSSTSTDDDSILNSTIIQHKPSSSPSALQRQSRWSNTKFREGKLVELQKAEKKVCAQNVFSDGKVDKTVVAATVTEKTLSTKQKPTKLSTVIEEQSAIAGTSKSRKKVTLNSVVNGNNKSPVESPKLNDADKKTARKRKAPPTRKTTPMKPTRRNAPHKTETESHLVNESDSEKKLASARGRSQNTSSRSRKVKEAKGMETNGLSNTTATTASTSQSKAKKPRTTKKTVTTVASEEPTDPKSSDPFDYANDPSDTTDFPLLKSSKKTYSGTVHLSKNPQRSTHSKLQSTINEDYTSTDISAFVTASASIIRKQNDTTIADDDQKIDDQTSMMNASERTLRPRRNNAVSYKDIHNGTANIKNIKK